MEKATPSLELGKAIGVTEPVLEGLIFGVAWRSGQEVDDAFGCGLVECCDHVVILGVFASDVPECELGFILRKPDCTLFWPEGGQLEADSVDLVVLIVLRHVVAAVCLWKLS